MADKIKNLSDAIELGASFKPKSVGAIDECVFAPDGLTVIERRTCAIGAAMDALGLLEIGDSERHAAISGRFPVLFKAAACPHHGCLHATLLYTVITHLNDHHAWTREAIAAWVREVEKAL